MSEANIELGKVLVNGSLQEVSAESLMDLTFDQSEIDTPVTMAQLKLAAGRYRLELGGLSSSVSKKGNAMFVLPYTVKDVMARQDSGDLAELIGESGRDMVSLTTNEVAKAKRKLVWLCNLVGVQLTAGMGMHDVDEKVKGRVIEIDVKENNGFVNLDWESCSSVISDTV